MHREYKIFTITNIYNNSAISKCAELVADIELLLKRAIIRLFGWQGKRRFRDAGGRDCCCGSHGSWSWRRDLSHSVCNTICRRSTHFSSEQLNLGLNLNYWPCLTPFTGDWALSAVIKNNPLAMSEPVDAEAWLVIFEFVRSRKKNQHTNKILDCGIWEELLVRTRVCVRIIMFFSLGNFVQF